MKIENLFSLMKSEAGWIGVDLDGTLAHWDGDVSKVGKPIGPMVRRVRALLKQGKDVRIFTARVADNPESAEAIQDWTEQHLGRRLPVTCKKDPKMKLLFDDRAVAVAHNTGHILGGVFGD